MKVYTFWDESEDAPERQGELLRIWERSWSRQGWEPRVLTVFNSRRSKAWEPTCSYFDCIMFALDNVGGGLFSNVLVFNRSLKPFRPPGPLILGRVSPWSLFYFSKPAIKAAIHNDPTGRFKQLKFGGEILDRVGSRASCLLFDDLQQIRASGVCL